MIDKTKQLILFITGGLLVAAFLVTMGFSIGRQSMTKATERTISQRAEQLVQKQTEKDKSSVLSQELVKDFLVQYYTKKQLGENNTRLKPYFTESAYREELTSQENPLRQVYKDYRLDYQFEEASIYVNSSTNEVLADVSYKVSYVADLEHKDQVSSNQAEQETVRLTYTKVGDKLLVNHMESIQTPLEELLNPEKGTGTSSATSAVPEIPNSTMTP